MTRPSHAALVEEVALMIRIGRTHDLDSKVSADAILSLIAARLSDVTPEMVEGYERNYANAIDESENVCVSDWRAMLAASPLNGGEKG